MLLAETLPVPDPRLMPVVPRTLLLVTRTYSAFVSILIASWLLVVTGPIVLPLITAPVSSAADVGRIETIELVALERIELLLITNLIESPRTATAGPVPLSL